MTRRYEATEDATALSEARTDRPYAKAAFPAETTRRLSWTDRLRDETPEQIALKDRNNIRSAVSATAEPETAMRNLPT